MTDPQFKLGDIVNGHRLTEQPDGAQAWIPVSTEQPHRPGDIANGHRLTQQPDGSLVWLPLSEGPKQKSRRPLWITLGAVGAVLLLIVIIGSLNRGSTAEQVAADKPAATAEPVDEVVEPEPVMVTIPTILTGMTAIDAANALTGIGLKPTYTGEPDATVIAITPAPGTAVKEGSIVTLTVEEKPKLTIGQQNAVGQAQSYLGFMPFSRTGLIEQLQYEGYSVEDATFAVDYVNPDWNAQAVKQAQSYLEYMSFSREGLVEQLIYEGFTPEQAEFGVVGVGY